MAENHLTSNHCRTTLKLRGGTRWSENVGWRKEVHPWMSAYCAFFALALFDFFPELSFALQYRKGRAEHALLHKDNNFYDARGYLLGYRQSLAPECEIITNLEEKDLLSSGLLQPKVGVRDLSKKQALGLAHDWIKEEGFIRLDKLPTYSCRNFQKR